MQVAHEQDVDIAIDSGIREVEEGTFGAVQAGGPGVREALEAHGLDAAGVSDRKKARSQYGVKAK